MDSVGKVLRTRTCTCTLKEQATKIRRSTKKCTRSAFFRQEVRFERKKKNPVAPSRGEPRRASQICICTPSPTPTQILRHILLHSTPSTMECAAYRIDRCAQRYREDSILYVVNFFGHVVVQGVVHHGFPRPHAKEDIPSHS